MGLLSWLRHQCFVFKVAADHGLTKYRSRVCFKYNCNMWSCVALRLSPNLNERQDEATVILCNNRSTIFIVKKPIHHGRTKHINIYYNFIRDLMKNGAIEVKHCSTYWWTVSRCLHQSIAQDKVWVLSWRIKSWRILWSRGV